MQHLDADSTDPMLRIERRLNGLESRKPWWRTTWLALAVIASAATAVPFVYSAIAWPWETKRDAEAAHQRLQDSIDTLRSEHQRGDAAILEAIQQLGEKMAPKKGHGR